MACHRPDGPLYEPDSDQRLHRHADFPGGGLSWLTPALSYKLLHRQNDALQHGESAAKKTRNRAKLYDFFNRLMRPFIEGAQAGKKRVLLFAGVTGLIVLAVALPVFQLVVLKMLPFDNKSEFQIIVDMPEGTPVEQTLTGAGSAVRRVNERAGNQRRPAVRRHGRADQLQRSGAPVLPAQYAAPSGRYSGESGGKTKHASARATPLPCPVREPLQAIGRADECQRQSGGGTCPARR